MRNEFYTFVSKLYTILKGCVEVKSRDKDLVRRGFILNTLLLCSLLLSSIAAFVVVSHFVEGQSPYSRPLEAFAYCFFFLFLYILSKKGHHKISSSLLICFYFFIVTQSAIKWGAGVPQGILIYALIVVMSGILMNSAFSFIVTTGISITLLLLVHLQMKGVIPTELSHDQVIHLNFGDSVVFVITFYLIATVSWLFNRESERALKRARISEIALKKERDSLAEKVIEKTKEVRQQQAEKITQLYRFAEFGKSASGFLHDLSNSVNLVSANLRQLENRNTDLKSMREMVSRARVGASRLESFISSTRKQVNNHDFLEHFSINDEINQAIEILSYKAKKAHVSIVFHPNGVLRTYGNPLKFHQLICNFVSNAIDAYEGSRKKNKQVDILLSIETDKIKIQVIDYGKGISKSDLDHIFEPFFTTKTYKKGTGIGLSISHGIVTKDFKGEVYVESKPRLGSTFTAIFPQQVKI